jgi:hypothetical protein
MAVLVQYTSKPLPGSSVAKVMEHITAGAALWKKHGASPRLWAVTVGEIGNMAFSAEFKDFAEYGKCIDKLNADPAFQAWRAKNQESGLSEWVRSNLLRELTP